MARSKCVGPGNGVLFSNVEVGMVEIEFPVDLDDVTAARRVAELCEKLNWASEAEAMFAVCEKLEKAEKDYRRAFVKLERMEHKKSKSLNGAV
jgi:hypothetical protein